MKQEPNGGEVSRGVVTVCTPEGIEYRIVTAMKGTPLRGTSISSDISTLIMELVLDLLLGAVGRRSSVRKVGVFEVRPLRPVHLKFKARLRSSEAARDLTEELAQEIQRGELRWARAARE